MKRTPTDLQFIVLTLLLVSLLGVRTAYSLIDEDYAEPSLAEVKSLNPLVDESNRLPASVPVKLIHGRSTLHSMMDVDLSCPKPTQEAFKISGQFVQFKGKNCLKNFKQEKIQIVNRSNGYTASIFPFGKDSYQTDMIQLVDGDNEITIRYSNPSGAAFEKIIKVSATSI